MFKDVWLIQINIGLELEIVKSFDPWIINVYSFCKVYFMLFQASSTIFSYLFSIEFVFVALLLLYLHFATLALSSFLLVLLLFGMLPLSFKLYLFYLLFQLIGMTELEVHTFEDTMRLLEEGSQGRTTGATAMNHHSSRSHAIFTIHLERTNRTDR